MLNGIKTNKLDAVKTCIMSEATLHNDFDQCVNLFKDFIKQNNLGLDTKEVTLAAVSLGSSIDSRAQRTVRRLPRRSDLDYRVRLASGDLGHRHFTEREHAAVFV